MGFKMVAMWGLASYMYVDYQLHRKAEMKKEGVDRAAGKGLPRGPCNLLNLK